MKNTTNTNIIENLHNEGFTEVNNYADMVNIAINMLNEDDELFVNMVNELDSWNGYADGYRCYSMDELNDFYCDKKVTDFFNDLTKDFNLNDDYFYYSIWGLESTSNVNGLYRDNTDTEDVYDEIIRNYNNLYLDYDEGFKLLIESIVSWDNEN